MKGWPARSEVEPILTTTPWVPSRIMIFTASCIRKKGARTFTANIVSKSSGEVLSRLPRVDMPAAFTRMSTRPKRASACAMIRRTSSMTPRSAPTTSTGTPLSAVISSATFRPLAASRPTVTIPAAPALAKSRAMAAPTPCVPPVTTATFPSMRFIAPPRIRLRS